MSAPHLEAEKRAILAAALPSVAFDGWSAETLRAATAAAGFEPSMALRAFPSGAVGLLEFFIAEADRRMLDDLAAVDTGMLKLRERIATAIRLRLTAQAGHREAIRKGLSVLALPVHAGRALRGLYRTVDAIWYAAGDTSTDFNFYSKRLLLAGVYSATLLYWLDDKSEGQTATWNFLDRRIGDVMRIQKLRGRLGGLSANWPDPSRLFRRRVSGR
ncbi:MAG TPA: COQ9 family protein [Candidatus Sulfotelmatobacter sp.]|nr:COQ9 family protein [Candidatus Sulfotelmatobacter sp.]